MVVIMAFSWPTVSVSGSCSLRHRVVYGILTSSASCLVFAMSASTWAFFIALMKSLLAYCSEYAFNRGMVQPPICALPIWCDLTSSSF